MNADKAIIPINTQKFFASFLNSFSSLDIISVFKIVICYCLMKQIYNDFSNKQLLFIILTKF